MSVNVKDIKLDYTKDELLDDYAVEILRQGYMVEGEKSPQEAFARAAAAFADDIAHAQRLYSYASKLWFGFASPVLSNAGNSRGLPISCFLNYVPDNRQGILTHYTENGWLSSMGGGIGGYWGAIRTAGTQTSRGVKSAGMIPFLHIADSQMLAFKQGEQRRGSYAAYLDISHPEIVSFLEMRRPTGGDINRKNLNMHHAVNIPNKFMEIIERCTTNAAASDAWDLIDPHTGQVRETVSAKALWESILTLRAETGEPYIHFIDTSNQYLPEAQKRLGLKINQSNLCSEILLATDEDRTAVCCLSSVNLAKFDEWRESDMIADLVRMLDNVLTFFINNAPDSMSKARYSAARERSIGLGAMGFHSYLQKNNVAFESEDAQRINEMCFESIRMQAEIASRKLALERGAAPDFIDSGVDTSQWRRNMHLLAVAPTAKNSIICGNTSPGIEPYPANMFVQKTQEANNVKRNEYLDKILRSKNLSEEELTKVWRSINEHEGSVQHLRVLTTHEKAVFKTAPELDQRWIVQHAADRQKYIDQGQSVNLFFYSDTSVKYLHDTHFKAWKEGLKTLYYLRPLTKNRAERIGTKVAKVDIKPKAVEEEKPFIKVDVVNGEHTFHQTQFTTKLATGLEIGCVGCEG